jgi:ATP-dependent Clp protease adaptor protein ClpS
MNTAVPFSIHSTSIKSEPKVQLEAPWQVIVMNDPVNLMPYVVMTFRKVFGFELPRARKHMLEVHEEGQSVVWVGQREQAEHYVYALQSWQLNALLKKAPL